MSAGHGQNVVWAVLNISEKRDANVKVDNFRMVKSDGTVVVLNWHPKDVDLAPGELKPIRDSIPKDARTGCYQYDILINGDLAQDPELQIDN
jgi:hypothetical protein